MRLKIALGGLVLAAWLGCGGGGAKSTVSPSPEAPTPTPTATATPTPTPTASSTPTPTPTASATPTPTPSATPSAPTFDISSLRSAPSAAAYYVDAVNGVDSHTGRSAAQAWKTLDQLHSVTLQPGDVVRLARGSVWTNQHILLDGSNTGGAQAPLIIEAYGTGAAPTINDPRALWDKTIPFAGVFVSGTASYVRILDLCVHDANKVGGITLDVGSHHVTVAGVEIYRSGSGVDVCGNQEAVLGSSIHDIGGTGTGSGIGIGLNGGSNVEVGWNSIRNCQLNTGGTPDGGALEFYGRSVDSNNVEHYAITDDIRIHHNVISGCYDFMEAYGNITNMVIAYNLYTSSDVEALEFHLDDSEHTTWTHECTYDVRIENNTFVPTQPASPGGWGIVGQLYDPNHLPDASKSHMALRNNIFVTNYKVVGKNVLGASFTHDHNLYQLVGSGILGASWSADATDKTGDPLFVNASAGNYHLGSTSPAINSGAVLGYTVDLAGTAVPQGSAPDMGAYEWNASDALVLRSQLASGDQARLQRLFDKGRQGKAVTLAVIGGSITEGAAASSPSKRWANLVQAWWTKTFPASTATLVNAGIGATCSDYGCLRVDRDVLAKNPDLVIVEYGVNDNGGGVDAFGDTYEGLVRKLLNAPGKPAVMLLFLMQYQPSSMSSEDWQSVIGAHYSLPMVSYFDAIAPELSAGRMLWQDLSPDGIHPNDTGHGYIGQFLAKTLDTALAAYPVGTVQAAIPATPAALRTVDMEFTTLQDGATLAPTANSGWTSQPAAGDADAGLVSATPGSTLDFSLTGNRLFFAYYMVQGPQGQVQVSVDGQDAGTFDSWFDQTWGGYRLNVALGLGLTKTAHTVHIKLLSTKNASSTGTTFRVLSLGSGGTQ